MNIEFHDLLECFFFSFWITYKKHEREIESTFQLIKLVENKRGGLCN